jgi:hypothetical protein
MAGRESLVARALVGYVTVDFAEDFLVTDCPLLAR